MMSPLKNTKRSPDVKKNTNTQISGQIELFEFLAEHHSQLPEDRVIIKGIVNIQSFPISDYIVQSTYKDIFLIINMLDDYVRLLTDPDKKNNSQTNYMIGEFARISKELAEQIKLDKEKMYKNCQKQNTGNDIGEDSMILSSRKQK